LPEHRSRWHRILDGLHIAGLAHALAQTEFFRTLLWPTVLTLTTGGAGVLGHIPVMYTLVACGVMFGSITTDVLRASEFRERQSPLNKLAILGTQVPIFLTPAPLLLPQFTRNPHQRRAQRTPSTPPQNPSILSKSTIVPVIKREIESGQIAVILQNRSTFPISCILHSSETELSTFKPPRSTFPKPASTLSPGAVFTIADDIIDMNNLPAGPLSGKIKMLVRYGLPGKEIYELHLNGDVHVLIEDYGLVRQTGVTWYN